MHPRRGEFMPPAPRLGEGRLGKDPAAGQGAWPVGNRPGLGLSRRLLCWDGPVREKGGMGMHRVNDHFMGEERSPWDRPVVAHRAVRNDLVWMLVVLGAAVLLSACSSPSDGTLPRADVAGIHAVLVFPFANGTDEPNLDRAVVQGVVDRLAGVGWYDVLAPERAEQPLAERRLETADMDDTAAAWLETARDIALELSADGFVVGAVVDHTDSLHVGAPYRNFDAQDVQWLADQTTRVTVTVRGKLINAHTGATVYERTVTGHGDVVEARQLNWVIAESPPASLVPAPHRRDVERARQRAVDDALEKLTADLLPQSE